MHSDIYGVDAASADAGVCRAYCTPKRGDVALLFALLGEVENGVDDGDAPGIVFVITCFVLLGFVLNPIMGWPVNFSSPRRTLRPVPCS